MEQSPCLRHRANTAWGPLHSKNNSNTPARSRCSNSITQIRKPVSLRTCDIKCRSLIQLSGPQCLIGIHTSSPRRHGRASHFQATVFINFKRIFVGAGMFLHCICSSLGPLSSGASVTIAVRHRRSTLPAFLATGPTPSTPPTRTS